jgi:F0F1-type ATP synthase epsilon subunit
VSINVQVICLNVFENFMSETDTPKNGVTQFYNITSVRLNSVEEGAIEILPDHSNLSVKLDRGEVEVVFSNINTQINSVLFTLTNKHMISCYFSSGVAVYKNGNLTIIAKR